MTIMLEDIKNKVKAEPSEELIALRGDVENDKPYWAESYTAEEWVSRKFFEKKCSEEDTYSGSMDFGDFTEFDV